MKKLSEYAKEHNITYRAAWNHFKRGLISGAYQLPNGTVVIPDNNTQDLEKVVQDLKNIIQEFKTK
jgi:predicted site-specific integrase-resolvase